jgi:hypothetical protein
VLESIPDGVDDDGIADDLAIARFSWSAVMLMWSTDFPLAQACRPTAWAMKVLPAPVSPINSSGRASLSHPSV